MGVVVRRSSVIPPDAATGRVVVRGLPAIARHPGPALLRKLPSRTSITLCSIGLVVRLYMPYFI